MSSVRRATLFLSTAPIALRSMDFPFAFRGVPEQVGILAKRAVEQQTPVIVTDLEPTVGNGNHPIRQAKNRLNLHICSVFHGLFAFSNLYCMKYAVG
jgi:hypothetical protein